MNQRCIITKIYSIVRSSMPLGLSLLVPPLGIRASSLYGGENDFISKR